MNVRDFTRVIGFAALAFATPLILSAATSVVGEGAAGLKITIADLDADALRLPSSSRAQALANPDAVQQAALNIYIRRILATEAARDNLDKDPAVQALLQLARERVLSDARLAKIDAAGKPTEEAIEAAAQANYKANPAKYSSGAQTRARHILLPGNTGKGRENAEKVLADLKAGANFEKVAKEQSIDPGSAERGGDLGWFDPGQMVPEFETAIGKLKSPGDLSEVVPTKFGFHIIKLEGRRAAGQRTYAEVRNEIREAVTVQLHNDVRLREAKRIADTFKADRPAIEAFSATHRK